MPEYSHQSNLKKDSDIQRADDIIVVLFAKAGEKHFKPEQRVENEDRTTSDEIKRRIYDLKCSVKERMIQVSIPADLLVKDFPYNVEVELINPIADTVANANFRGITVDWYIKADDIVLKNKGGQAGNFLL